MQETKIGEPFECKILSIDNEFIGIVNLQAISEKEYADCKGCFFESVCKKEGRNTDMHCSRLDRKDNTNIIYEKTEKGE